MARRQDPALEQLLRGPEGATVTYLLDVATELESRLLGRWIAGVVGHEVKTVRIPSARRGRGGDLERLDEILISADDPYLIPVRVVWMAPEKEGRRSVRWSDAFKPGDPRDPRGLRAYWIRTFRPSRIRLIAAQGARASGLLARHDRSGEVDGPARYVTRQAWKVLDQSERRLRGNRYKIPRFVSEAILSRGEFLEEVDNYSEASGVERSEARSKAEKYLREIAATHSPYTIDLIANAIHALYRQGYGEIEYDPSDVAAVAELGSTHPIVFLPSHRSNLDRLSLQFMLWENDLPPNHTAGGVNLDFFPVGPLMRRTGVFFIRRSFKDNELYKIVLQAYLDYLIEKRFPLEWYMEGGRSRSGRLQPPRFGLLHYVVDALRRGKSDDLILVPVSITYDHIQDVPDYAREAQGKSKEKESLGWLVRAVKSLRRQHGDIHIRFGDPVSVATLLSEGEIGDEESIGLQKIAFEVMFRIGRATPFTPTAIVSIALLAARGSARTAGELSEQCIELCDFISARGIEITDHVDLTDPSQVEGILSGLAEHKNVSSHEAVGRKVYWLDDDQMIRISYYRNIVAHFFVNRAIAEMALNGMVEDGEREAEIARRRMLELRDLLKFEFFFPEKDRYLADVSADLEIGVPDWESTLDVAGAFSVIAKLGPPVAYWSVLPFLDAYQIVGDELESLQDAFDERSFLKACLARAKMYRIEGRLISGESASQVLFKSALALARNRDLIDDSPLVAERRAEFAAEIRAARSLAATGIES